MKIEARKWDGEEWPEKRVSIADTDTKFCLFVSARYADIDEAKIQANEVCRRVNCHDELVEALVSMVEQYWYSTEDTEEEFEKRPDVIAAREIIAKATVEQ